MRTSAGQSTSALTEVALEYDVRKQFVQAMVREHVLRHRHRHDSNATN